MTIKERVRVWLFGWLEDRLDAQAYRDAEHLLLLQKIAELSERCSLQMVGVTARLEAIADMFDRDPRLRHTAQRVLIADWDEVQRQNLKQFEEI